MKGTGFFITGTDTGVGQTVVAAAAIAATVAAAAAAVVATAAAATAAIAKRPWCRCRRGLAAA